ncbi:MAG: type II toxin-antitoxin system VapC family toxin [Nitrospira sp.]|nr:type II toxin-antitoxin system VapC family toxin [Nitrospira sp.]
MRDDAREVVLDACALLRLLQDEPGAEEVDRLLCAAQAGRTRALIHIVNLGEVIYTIGKARGWEPALRTRSEISLLPLIVIPFSEDLFWHAVELKARYRMSYADCFAAALAITAHATLLTSDPEFEVLRGIVKLKHI